MSIFGSSVVMIFIGFATVMITKIWMKVVDIEKSQDKTKISPAMILSNRDPMTEDGCYSPFWYNTSTKTMFIGTGKGYAKDEL